MGFGLRLSTFLLGLSSSVHSTDGAKHAQNTSLFPWSSAGPPLGYSTWNYFPFKGIDEATCFSLARSLVSLGFPQVWRNASGPGSPPPVFIVDEPCFVGRDNRTGQLLENRTAWPNGLAHFAKYLISVGMELGIYTDAGSLTCQQCPGSKGHEQLDLFTFAKEMGARYVKVDRCFAVDSEPMIEALPETFATQWAIPANLSAAEAPQLSLILAGTDNVWAWAGKVPAVRHWRTTQDVYNSFQNILFNLDSQQRVPSIEAFAGAGLGWNDLDMQHVGFNYNEGGLPLAQAQSSIGLMAMLKSPMLLSCDVARLQGWERALLQHAEVLALHQDALGTQATRIGFNGQGQNGLGLSQQQCVPATSPPPPNPAPASVPAPHPQQVWEVVAASGRRGQGGAGGLVMLRAVNQLAGAAGALRAGGVPTLCATAANCGASSNTAVMLCPCEVGGGGGGFPGACSNATCGGTDRLWQAVPVKDSNNSSGGEGLGGDVAWYLLQSAADNGRRHGGAEKAVSLCLEGVMGPGPSSAQLRACDSGNENQAWALPAAGGAAGTVTANESRCLTADPAPNPSQYGADVFAVPLSDGSVAALLLNRRASGGKALVAFALSDTAVFFKSPAPNLRVVVWDVWQQVQLGEFAVFGGSVPLQLQPYGSSLLRLRPVT